MPYNQTGTFTPLITFQDATPALAEDQNSQDADIAGGLTQCLTRGGLAPATANISFGGFKLTNLGAASDPGDAINLSLLGSYTFTEAQIIASLTYTPANKAGDTFTGSVHFGAGAIVDTGGLTVTVGNLAVTAGALSVSGAATLSNGATVSNGLTVSSGPTTLGTATASTVAATDNSTNVATTAFVNNAVPLVTAAAAFGAVGSLACASSSGVDVAPGGTIAGSALTSYHAGSTSSVTLSGTWRFLGTSNSAPLSNGGAGQLYLRIS